MVDFDAALKVEIEVKNYEQVVMGLPRLHGLFFFKPQHLLSF
jgi:hypothetical protein